MDGRRSSITAIHHSDTAGSKPWGLVVDYVGKTNNVKRLWWITKLDTDNQDSISEYYISEYFISEYVICE
jgi:hypothetical protein